ncbi:MFS transporter [Candidatus Woesearchaeota archaeon]|nr:MFS transporter [Candidatus Woesearchaeota archaeon]
MKHKIRKMRKNLRMYYGFRVLCAMNFIMPIFMLFLIDKGLSSFEIVVTQAAYTLTEMLLTVPSGAFADKVGRKKTLILSTIVYSVALGLYAFVDSFVQVLLVEMVFAIASAAFHGTGEAFLYDTLAEAKQEKKYKKVLGTAYALQSVVIGLAAVAGGLMAKHDLALPFLVSAFPVALSIVPLFLLDEPKRKNVEDASYFKLIRDATVYVAGHRRLRNIMYFVGVTTLVGFMGFMLYQPMLTEMGMPIEYLGVVMMVMSVAHGLGNKIAHRFEKRLGHLDLMFVFTGFRALLYLLVYLASGYYLVVWAVVLDLVSGLASPIVSEWVNRHSMPENRATVLSLSSMAGCLSFSLFSPLLGLYVDAYSSQACYLLLAIILGAYALRQIAVLLLGRLSRG